MAVAPRKSKPIKNSNPGRAVSVSRAATNTGMMPADAPGPAVSYLRTELALMLPVYHLIRDCLMGERQIKLHDRGPALGNQPIPFGMVEYAQTNLFGQGRLPYEERYLPKPNPSNMSEENSKRYHDYITRALFYNFTRRTLDGLIGAVFLRAPVVELPDALEVLEDNATGGGVSLVQLAKQGCKLVVAYGRAGLLVDYPRTAGRVTTVADKAGGTLRPTINLYAPWTVTNWRETWRNGQQQLTLVVIAEIGVVGDDGFAEKTCEQYRVLRLLPDSVYEVSTWRRDGDNSAIVQYDTVIPTDASGKPFDHIPFKFVGPEDNGVSVDAAPLSDLAALNIAHYRNSADYEESSYLVGQPTPVFTGLTEQWVEDVLGGVVSLGARAAVMLPVGATAELMQAAPNQIPLEGMRHKEAQAISLGARLIEEKKVQRTATQSTMDDVSSKSILATAAANVSQAILWALQECCAFEGVTFDETTLKFEINTELDLISLSPEDRKQLLSEWQIGGITYSEYRHNMQRSGITQLDVDAALAELKVTPAPATVALEAAAVLAQATNDKTKP